MITVPDINSEIVKTQGFWGLRPGDLGFGVDVKTDGLERKNLRTGVLGATGFDVSLLSFICNSI